MLRRKKLTSLCLDQTLIIMLLIHPQIVRPHRRFKETSLTPRSQSTIWGHQLSPQHSIGRTNFTGKQCGICAICINIHCVHSRSSYTQYENYNTSTVSSSESGEESDGNQARHSLLHVNPQILLFTHSLSYHLR